MESIDKAVQDASAAIRLDPRYFEAYLNRAAARSFARQFAEAEADFTEAIRLRPDSGEAYLSRGTVR